MARGCRPGKFRFGVNDGRIGMNKIALNTCVLLSSLIVPVLVLAQDVKGASQPALSPVVLPAAELHWIDLDPIGAPGVKVADLWGDHRTGPFGAIFRLPAGFSAPLHTHTH